MNKSYRSVWNQALGAWVAISEIDRACGHGRGVRSALVLAGALAVAASAGAHDIPYTNGEMRADAIVTTAPSTWTLRVATPGAEANQTGLISGSGGIVKAGAGTLVLGRDVPAATSANTYTGGTVLDEGTLAVTHAGSLGTGTLTINGGTLRGGATLANDVVVKGDFTVAPLDLDSTPAAAQRSLRLDGDVKLDSAGTPTIRFVSPASSVTYLLELGGVVSGTRGLTIEAPASARYWGDLDFVGGKSNTYTGLTTVQGSTVLGLARTGGATSIAGDLLVQGASSVAFLQSEQIADTSTVTIRSQGFDLIHPDTGAQVHLPGMVFLRPHLTETVGTLLGDGTIVLGSSTLRTGAGDFAGTISDAGVPGVAADGRIVKYGPGVFTLSGANGYAGGTTVEGGTLRVANDGALGTGGLTLAGGTTLDYDAARVARIANAITLTGTATLNVDAGSVRQSGAIGERGGSQGLVKTGAGTLELTAANGFSGGTDLRAGLIDMQTTGALGTGDVRVAAGAGLRVGGGTTTLADLKVANAGVVDVSRTTATAIGSLDGAGDVRLGGSTLTLGGLNRDDAIAGAIQDGGAAGGTGGALVKTGTGTLVLSGANTHTGATAIDAGTLKAGAAYTLSAASAHAVAVGATLDLAGLSQRVASLSNSGTVSVLGATPGTDLTVTGAYVGNGGTLRLGTALGTSASVSDRLVLDGAGASASGRTTVQVTNLGGLGALTTGNGIEIVAARNGATTTAQTTRSAFALAGGHVDAGAYAYTLHAADASGAGESWYLRSSAPAVVTPPVTTPTTPVTTPTTPVTTPTTPVTTPTTPVTAPTTPVTTPTTPATAPTTPVTTPTPPVTPAAPTTGASQDSTLSATVRPELAAAAGATVPNYRAEVPLFAALPQQLRQADLAMLGNLHQRIGDEPAGMAAATGTATDADGKRRNAWGRVVSTRIDVRQQGTVDPSSRGRVDGFQVGTDLLAGKDWRAGVYVGQLDGRVATSGFAGGTWGGVGSNDLRSRYLGLYGTYMNASGFYADAVLQAGNHRVNAEPLGNATAPVRGDSLLASIEAGRSFALGRGWRIEPQVQLIHQRIDLDDTAISGATVQHDAGNGWIARAGVRVKGEMTTSAGLLQPYGRVNVYGATHGTDIARFVGPAASTDIATRTGGTWAEAAVGSTLAIDRTWSVYGEVGRLFSAGGDTRVKSGVQGSIGVKARW
jgi:outer membrane autotransporter protein